MEYSDYSPGFANIAEWKAKRQLCRTDLKYLCWVLGYKDVQDKVHGKMLHNVQHFAGGEDHSEPATVGNAYLKKYRSPVVLPRVEDILKGYEPYIPNLWDLPGVRSYQNMIPRGCLKSTVITCAHVLQWIINYPNIRILLFSHTDGSAKQFLTRIGNHFISTLEFRQLFPEHVPWGKGAASFSITERFNTLARTDFSEKEKTLQYLTVDSAKSSSHFECVFIDDAVDEENVKTPERIETVKRSIAALEPLVDKRESEDGGQRGWTYFTGTFYDSSDAGFQLYEEEHNKIGPKQYEQLMAMPDHERIAAEKRIIAQGYKPKPKQWSINVQSAAPNWPNGPFLWPERYGYKVLKAIEDDPLAGPASLAAQYLMNPVPPGSGLIEKQEQINFIPRQVINGLYARLQLDAIIDLAGMNPQGQRSSSNDYTVLTVAGFGTDGHIYIPEMHHGRMTEAQLIDLMYAVYARHPRIRRFKMPEDLLGQVIMPTLKREREKRGWIPVVGMKIDNQQSKKHKIKGLQPFFAGGMIHFADDLPCRTNIILEITRFPRYSHDDILDTIHGAIFNSDGTVVSDLMGAPKEPMDASIAGKMQLKNPDGTVTFIERPVNAQPFNFNKVFGLDEDSGLDSGLIGGW